VSGFTGTATMLRLDLRRDRLLLPVGVLTLVALAGSSARATVALYPDPASAIEAARVVAASAALTGMYGPIADPGNPDSVAVFKTMVMGGIFTALLAYAVVRRHTRTEEESGRSELLGAGVLGRRATLGAAVLLAGAAVLLTGTLTTLSLVAAGLGTAGSVAFGMAWVGIGLSFTGITAVAAQLTATARGCAAVVLGALGVAYLLRAVGDTSSGAVGQLTWLSPLGWAEKLEMFGADRFVVGLVPLVFAAAMVGLAFALLERRDLGAGLIAPRPGPAGARVSLGSPRALAWRLQRGGLICCAAAYLVLGLVLGGVAGNVGALVNTPGVEELLRAMGGDATSLADVFVSTELRFLAFGAAAYGIFAALRLRAEEVSLHLEQLLSTRVSRTAVLLSHAGPALAGSAGLMLVLGLGLAVSVAPQEGLGPALGHVLPAAISTIPAIWVCVGLALVIFGGRPRAVGAAWGILAAFLLLAEFGPLLGLPTAVIDLSPFSHGSVVPGGVPQPVPLLVLLALAGALVVAAVAAFRRRDLGRA